MCSERSLAQLGIRTGQLRRVCRVFSLRKFYFVYSLHCINTAVSTTMSTKHPFTTDSITFGSRADSPDMTGDFSDSGDPTLVQWKRRPYDSHVIQGSTAGLPGRFPNDYRPPSTSNPVDDLDFDAKPSSTYQSLTHLPQGPTKNYEDIDRFGSVGPEGGKSMTNRSLSSIKCSVCLLAVIALLSFLLACGAIALTSYAYFVRKSPQDEKVSDLETQLSAARDTITELQVMMEELRLNVSKNAELNNDLGQLSAEVSSLSESVDELVTAANTTNASTSVNLYEQCSIAQRLNTCNIDQVVIQVSGSTDDLPGYSSCSTLVQPLNEPGYRNIDVYCAVSDPRGEENPQMATLRVSETTNEVWCYCFVTAYKDRQGVVSCSLYATRCPITQELQL